MDIKNHEFLSMIVNPPYNTGKTVFNKNYSRDGGDSVHMESNHALYGTYFFLQESVNEFSYEANNFVSLVSELGGFIEIIYIFLMLIPFLYNSRIAHRKFIDKLYLIKKDEKPDPRNTSIFADVNLASKKNFTADE